MAGMASITRRAALRAISGTTVAAVLPVAAAARQPDDDPWHRLDRLGREMAAVLGEIAPRGTMMVKVYREGQSGSPFALCQSDNRRQA